MSTAEIPIPEQVRQSTNKSSWSRWLIIPAAIVLLGVTYSVYTRVHQGNSVSQEAKATSFAPPFVRAVSVRTETKPYTVDLPGSTEGIETASINARSSGYIRSRYVDIGSNVRAGQLLAVIDSPEADQELVQGRANEAQAEAAYKQTEAAQALAEANLTLAKLTTDRYTTLAARDVVSKQEGDERMYAFTARQADVESAKANVAAGLATLGAQRANVARLAQAKRYEKVTAPFAGVVTTRNIDTGDLIAAGTQAERPLFTIARTDSLRVQVPVPQAASAGIHIGLTAQVTSPSRPGKIFTGRVVRTAEAITPSSRTLASEVQIDNRDGALLPGMYVNVQFQLTRQKPVVIVPAEALIVNGSGTRVAILHGDTVSLKNIELGKDSGRESEVQSGLVGTEMVLLSPPADLADGQKVRIQLETSDGQQKQGKP